MGRQAKIRQQRKQSALGEASPTSGKSLSQDAAKISSLGNKPLLSQWSYILLPKSPTLNMYS
jgi:hypothetical protein